jgi:hypothetical protein
LRYLALIIIALAVLFASACSSLVVDAASVAALHSVSDYNPQAPTIAVPTLDLALASATWLRSGAFDVTALDSLNQPDVQTKAVLRLSSVGNTLRISNSMPVVSAGLYVRYDADRFHPVELNAERLDAVSLATQVRRGLIAVGVAGMGGNLLNPGAPLAEITLAAGADNFVPRRTSIRITPNNAVGVDAGTEDDLVALDNANSSATLSWQEQHTGDYDLNGLVTINDISPIGSKLNHSTTDGIQDAEDEVVDGDKNGLITIAELTPLGSSLNSSITGYNVYRTLVTGPGDTPDPADTGRWTKVPNTAEPTGPSAPRQYNGQKTRLTYTFIDNSGLGQYAWYVAATSPASDPFAQEGPSSNVAIQTVTPAGPPPAGLSFEITSPGGEFRTVDDEFYVAVKVTGVSDLFSANVRFEYDGSVVQFVEGVPSYNDGTDHPNFLELPLFVSVDDVDAAQSPYVLLGFNDTQKQGTPAKSGDGYLGYFKFKAVAPGIIDEAFRFPQASNFIYLWGETYGDAVAQPGLGSPQLLNIAP